MLDFTAELNFYLLIQFSYVRFNLSKRCPQKLFLNFDSFKAIFFPLNLESDDFSKTRGQLSCFLAFIGFFPIVCRLCLYAIIEYSCEFVFSLNFLAVA